MKQKKTIIKVSDILSHAYFSLLAFKLPVSLLFVVSIMSRDGTMVVLCDASCASFLSGASPHLEVVHMPTASYEQAS
jgi:hypothetical protein